VKNQWVLVVAVVGVLLTACTAPPEVEVTPTEAPTPVDSEYNLTVYSPEMFGEQKATASTDENGDVQIVVDYIHDGQLYAKILVTGATKGTITECTVTNLGPGLISGFEGPLPCRLSWEDNWFRGWIDWRGHPRKFCGAFTSAYADRFLPWLGQESKCMFQEQNL
jgi:hypothetical protein